MNQIIIVLLAVFGGGCMILGIWIGRWYERRFCKPKFKVEKKIFEVAVMPTDRRRLVYIGELDERLGKWLANEILDGRPFTFSDMCKKYGKGGRLSEAQYKKVRADFVDRRVATYDAGTGRTTLHPPAFAVCRKIAGRGKGVSRK